MSDLVRRTAPLPVRWREDGRPVPETLLALGPGVTWWEDFRGALGHRIRTEKQAGRVVVLKSPQLLAARRQGLPVYGALVRVLKPAPPRWRKPLIIAAVIFTVLGVLGYGVWLLVAAIMSAAQFFIGWPVAVLILWILFSLAKGHPCPGLHCPGCKSGR